jgi:hypothetical protein
VSLSRTAPMPRRDDAALLLQGETDWYTDIAEAALSGIDVWIDREGGFTNKGTMGGLTIVNDGMNTSNDPKGWQVPGAAQGLHVAGFSGDVSYPVSSGALAGAEQGFAFVTMKLEDLTGASGTVRLFAHKGSTTSTVAGLSIDAATSGSDVQPRIVTADGTTTLRSGGAYDINNKGVVTIFVFWSWFFVNYPAIYIYDQDGRKLYTVAGNFTGLSDFTISDPDLAFFAGSNGTDAAGGINGTRTLTGIAAGFSKGAQIFPEHSYLSAIAKYYGSYYNS